MLFSNYEISFSPAKFYLTFLLVSRKLSKESAARSSTKSGETNSLLSYLDDLLLFFDKNLSLGLQDEKLAKKYNTKIKAKLFEIFDDEMAQFYNTASAIYEKTRDPNVFGDLEESIENSIQFRRNVSVQYDKKLEEIRQNLKIRSNNSINLMSKYLKGILKAHRDLAEISDENMGNLTFVAGMKDSDLYVHLKGVSNLKPRENKENCNFRIAVSILPLKINENTYKMSNKTLVYHNRNNHLVILYSFKLTFKTFVGLKIQKVL